MQPADRIRDLFKNGKLTIQADADEQVFQDMVRAHNQSKNAEGKAPSVWRITMRSPITKLAIAAVLVIVCLMGMMMWKGTSSGVALANVLAQVQQISAYMYQMTMTVDAKGLPGRSGPQNIDGDILIAQNHGMKIRLNITDPKSGKVVRQEQYVLPEEKALISVAPDEKQYVRMDLDDTMLERIRKQNNDPSTMLERIVACKYESLGRSTIDGVKVEGFRTTDPNYMLGMGGEADVKIWVDVKTLLPVRMEMDVQMAAMDMHGVMDRFQWDYPVNETTFKPVFPDDYKTLPGGPVKTPAMDEAGAIAGLKLFAELSGKYPQKLDLLSVMQEMAKAIDPNSLERHKDSPAIKKLLENNRGASPEEAAKKTLDLMFPIQGAGMFYTMLVQDQKDPAYYGKTVTPADADKVLLRWKIADDEYRVIFGDLHAATVKADVLAELEKSLPK